MCVIVYKPKDIDFPTKETLKACWTKNDDGAGFMFPLKNKVVIKKGFMTFDDFYNALTETINTYGTKRPYVMHFRITTQGGVQAKLTHPYPLSKNMKDLQELNFTSDIGVAHNGIISLTSCAGEKEYNDTMKFITDYLALIIKHRTFYNDEDTLTLIKSLCKSKLCILDGAGHVQLIGDFIKGNDNCYYSNKSFENYVPSYGYGYNDCNIVYGKTGYWDCGVFHKYRDFKSEKSKPKKEKMENSAWKPFKRGNKYYFIHDNYCPKSMCDDCSYCGACAFCKECGIKSNKEK